MLAAFPCYSNVVHNHFGPDGNYLPVYAPKTYTDRYRTPWGDTVNFDDDSIGPVRKFIIHNALYWIEDFHLDGLRLNAVHAIINESSQHLLDELAERLRARAAATGKDAAEASTQKSRTGSRGDRGSGSTSNHPSGRWPDPPLELRHVRSRKDPLTEQADRRSADRPGH